MTRARFADLRAMTPAQYVDDVVEIPGRPLLRDGQVHFLRRGLSSRTLDAALEIVARHGVILLPLDRFEEALLLLGRIFPEWFRDLRFVPENRSTRDATVEAALAARVREFQHDDLALHRRAHEFLDAGIETHFQNGSDLERARRALSQRCRAYARRRRLSAWLRRRSGTDR